jgi:hypothetical protein
MCVLGFGKGDLKAIIIMRWWQEEKDNEVAI